MSVESYDVAIVGSGPAGSAAALALEQCRLRVALIDKSRFPRDKICGDALSPDTVNQLFKLSKTLGEDFLRNQNKGETRAVKLISPSGYQTELEFASRGLKGYVMPRVHFDHLLQSHAVRSTGVTTIFEPLTDVRHTGNGVELKLKSGRSVLCQMVVGADGANSAVRRLMHPSGFDENHHCAGLRCYFSNVDGFSNNNAIELHFFKNLLPGYFWIFPLADNKANVGLGMLSSAARKRKVNLKKLLFDLIEHEPALRRRFKHAKSQEKVRGFGLPLGGVKRSISGDRYLLTGDAAWLINPLSGEGIANAIRSGRIAARHIAACFDSGRFDAEFNSNYDQMIYDAMWNEFRINSLLQRTLRSPAICELTFKYALGFKPVQQWIMSGFNV
ncbi:MAG: geranylgeranyl reductase family protein [Salibacteraceae bacterium]